MDEKPKKKKKGLVAKILASFSLVAVVGFLSIFLIYLNKKITVTYTNAIGEEKRFSVKFGTTIDSIGKAEETEGYEFSGWFKDQDYTIPYDLSDKINQDLRIYAKYENINYTITYLSNNGKNETKVETVPSYSNIKLPENTFALENYVFAGWSADQNDIPDSSTVLKPGDNIPFTTGDLKFYAIWQKRSIEVRLKINYQDENNVYLKITDDNSKYGDSVAFPTIETVLNLLAQKGYEITPVNNHGDTERWTFEGWGKNQNGECNPNEALYDSKIETNYTISGDIAHGVDVIELYAQYSRNTTSIAFNNNEGSGSIDKIVSLPTKETYEFTEAQILNIKNNLHREYFTLIGFHDINDPTNSFSINGKDKSIYVGTNEVTLVADWIRNKVNVSYYKESDSSVPQSFDIDQGSTLTLTNTDFYRYGFKLVGFTYNQQNYEIGDSIFLTQNAVITPIWVELNAVEFVGTGDIDYVSKSNGTITKISDVSAGDKIFLPNYADTQYAYVDEGNVRKYFVGWALPGSESTLYAGEELTVSNNFDSYHPVYMEASNCFDYVVDEENKTATVTYNGSTIPNNILIYPNTYVKNNVTYEVITMKSLTEESTDYKPLSATHIIVSEGIKNIGINAFNSCINLTNIALPQSIIEIGLLAFSGCSKLKTIDLPKNLNLIYGNCFSGCSILETITLHPENTNYSIQNGSLIKDSALIIGTNSSTIPSGITKIEGHAFNGRANLVKVEIPEGVEELATSCFASCQNLTDVILPNTLATIGIDVFSRCINLEKITLPNSINKIEKWAFAYCTGLKEITIPKQVEKIENSVFIGCDNLTNINFDNTNGWYAGGIEISGQDLLNSATAATYLKTNYISVDWERIDTSYLVFSEITDESTGEVVSYSVKAKEGIAINGNLCIPNQYNNKPVTKIETNAFKGCATIEKVVIPNTITVIDERAFEACGSTTKGLTVVFEKGETPLTLGIAVFNASQIVEITISNRIQALNTSTFFRCYNLQTVNFEENSQLNFIDNAAFIECTNLTTINLPDSITYIGAQAFMGCSALKSITIPENTTTIDVTAFSGCTALANVVFGNPEGWYAGAAEISSQDLSNSQTAANFLKNTYSTVIWERKQ